VSFDPTTRTALSVDELGCTTTDTVGRSHHAQKQLNLDIVNHVARYGPCGFVELYDLFGSHLEEGKKTTERFRARLGHLTYTHQLVATGTAGARRWRMPLIDAQPAQGAAPADLLPAWVGTAAPAPAYDCMHGPTYVPERPATPRAGSLDFQRLASRGDRC